MPDQGPASALLDRSLIEEIRRIERATGKNDVLSGFVLKLEGHLAGFATAFSGCIARGDNAGAVRVAHTLKGTCRQLGAQALGNLFAEIEASAKAGDYAGAKRKFDGAGALITESIQALKDA
jgi:HPt (histidine-containing phosphotransfer) domain-containing protein